MAQTLPEKRENMFVIKGIEDHPALAARSHDASVSKHP
jgi:hypothetical protein